jgi:hypothetical protein
MPHISSSRAGSWLIASSIRDITLFSTLALHAAKFHTLITLGIHHRTKPFA